VFKKLFSKDYRIYCYKGRNLLELGDIPKAVKLFDKAIKRFPLVPELYVNRGLAYSSAGNYQQAIFNYTRALQLDDQNSKIFSLRAVAFELSGDDSSAKKDHYKALEILGASQNIGDCEEDIQNLAERCVGYGSKGIFQPLKGLERVGLSSSKGVLKLKTKKTLKAGDKSNTIKIPLYSCCDYSEGTTTEDCNYLGEIRLNGYDLPKDLPKGSEVVLTIEIYVAGNLLEIDTYIPYLGFHDLSKIPYNHRFLIPGSENIKERLEEASSRLDFIDNNGYYLDQSEINNLKIELDYLKDFFTKEDLKLFKSDIILGMCFKFSLRIDEFLTEWNKLRQLLEKKMVIIEERYCQYSDEETVNKVSQLRYALKLVFANRNIKMSRFLNRDMDKLIELHERKKKFQRIDSLKGIAIIRFSEDQNFGEEDFTKIFDELFEIDEMKTIMEETESRLNDIENVLNIKSCTNDSRI